MGWAELTTSEGPTYGLGKTGYVVSWRLRGVFPSLLVLNSLAVDAARWLVGGFGVFPSLLVLD